MLCLHEVHVLLEMLYLIIEVLCSLEELVLLEILNLPEVLCLLEVLAYLVLTFSSNFSHHCTAFLYRFNMFHSPLPVSKFFKGK